MESRKIIVAIDGKAGAGKATIAKEISSYYGIPHIDTGLIYRFVAYQIIQKKIWPQESELIKELSVDYQEIVALKPYLANEKVASIASNIARNTRLRFYLIDYQRKLAHYHPLGAVVDGRDIGSIILPDAKYKFFIDASLKTRAVRRFKQLRDQGKSVMYGLVLCGLVKRDYQDINRKTAPLVRTPDACYINTDSNALEEILELITKIIS